MLANGGWDLIQRLTLILLTWTIWRAPTNASKWRMGFNSALKGLKMWRVIVVSDHTMRQVHTLGRTTLDEGSARRRGLYLTTHSIHKRQASISASLFEPAIRTGYRRH